jgi:hypothetical protein
MVNNRGEQIMLERQQYEAVKNMTGLELAKIETDEMHPLYQAACDEIDARVNKRHAIDDLNEADEWDRSFQSMQERETYRMTGLLDDDERSDDSLRSDRLAHEEASHRSWLRADTDYDYDALDNPFERDFQETEDLHYYPA